MIAPIILKSINPKKLNYLLTLLLGLEQHINSLRPMGRRLSPIDVTAREAVMETNMSEMTKLLPVLSLPLSFPLSRPLSLPLNGHIPRQAASRPDGTSTISFLSHKVRAQCRNIIIAFSQQRFYLLSFRPQAFRF